jgi:hypothetical protein
MGRGRVALAAGLVLVQLGAVGALGSARDSRAARTSEAHAAATVAAHAEPDPAGRPPPHAAPPCHEAHGSGGQATPPAPLTLNERCPCGCGGLPGVVPDHGGSAPALLAAAYTLAPPSPEARSAAAPAAAPAGPARSVDHVPIPS